MTMINLSALGITDEALVQKIVDATVERMLTSVGYDEEGDEFTTDSRVVKNFNGAVQKMIDAKVESLGNAHVLPLVESRLESLVLQKTNAWGEKAGTPVTFIEYLIQRADAYMAEPVDLDGKTRGESGSSFWNSKTTRVSHMIDRYLKYSIETAMQHALKDANSSIAKGLEGAVKMALAEVQAKLKVEVKV